MLAEILQGLVKFGYSVFRIVRAVVVIVVILFAIVIFGELIHCNGGSSTPNAVHWRP